MFGNWNRTLFLLVISIGGPAHGQPLQADDAALTPTHANVRYGPHERNVLDIYLAKSDTPTPLVLYIHGGGFSGGDKNRLSRKEGRSFLAAGFSPWCIPPTTVDPWTFGFTLRRLRRLVFAGAS